MICRCLPYLGMAVAHGAWVWFVLCCHSIPSLFLCHLLTQSTRMTFKVSFKLWALSKELILNFFLSFPILSGHYPSQHFFAPSDLVCLTAAQSVTLSSQAALSMAPLHTSLSLTIQWHEQKRGGCSVLVVTEQQIVTVWPAWEIWVTLTLVQFNYNICLKKSFIALTLNSSTQFSSPRKIIWLHWALTNYITKFQDGHRLSEKQKTKITVLLITYLTDILVSVALELRSYCHCNGNFSLFRKTEGRESTSQWKYRLSNYIQFQLCYVMVLVWFGGTLICSVWKQLSFRLFLAAVPQLSDGDRQQGDCVET